jgi:two-component system, OmpR family, phosphate regulon sensor histidine kinase PhoR
LSAAGRTSLARRLLVGYTLTVVAVLGGLAIVLDRTLEATFLDDLTASMADQAEAVDVAIRDTQLLQPDVRALGERLEVRITIVREDGTVLADSVRDPASMENHRDRPEIAAALRGRTGVASRTSETTGEPYRYLALPPTDGRVVRVALPLSVIQERLGNVRGLIAGGTALACGIGIAAVWLVARRVTRPLRDMTRSVERISSGDLRTRVPSGGASELALLGQTLNRMAAELEARLEDLARDRQRRDDILSAMDDGVILVDASGAIGYANAAAARLLGPLPDELRALAPAPLRTLVEEARNGDRLLHRDLEDGSPPRVLRASAVPLADPGGVLLVVRDVTSEVRVEAMRRDFVGDASHELKTPVAAIRAAAETVERAANDDPAAAARFARQLRQDAVRLSGIVSDLLDLSRLETEPSNRDPVRLDRVVEEEVRRVRSQAEDAGVDVESEVRPVTVPGSVKDLALLARNLLENAVRYTPRGGRVIVEVGGEDGHATLSVQDTGMGIPSRDLPRVFERFYRVDRARSRETGGTGLGLSIARHVVERHGGVISAESELGRGSIFRVTLPAGAA